MLQIPFETEWEGTIMADDRIFAAMLMVVCIIAGAVAIWVVLSI